ncbi:protein arginine N-methyltransferase 5 [Babesia microti strain RI]|uniref:Protein arginine N-methyltransferase 5 n=1 Tax=Babesia microti (strain RI) TaxID=1133968 RepID=A0A0K3AQ85_BABMR|nr:protein arginine N-methyltransferase 5 [Babesia microti strain RI]CTQ40605.1 protein arginine N-methyltransferase 5 [Babesia microti strain RI]|eukprot:XP_012648616.1 protein arginine N-methyltransferase 5 [Babesia microti strain RI]
MSLPLIGVTIAKPLDITSALKIIENERITFIACPLICPVTNTMPNDDFNAVNEFTAYYDSFHKLSSEDFYSKVVGLTMPYCGTGLLSKELEWSAYLGTRALIVQPPAAALNSPEFSQFANCLNNVFEISPLTSIWLKLSVLDNLDIWRSLHKFCGPFSSITIILSFLADGVDTIDYLCNYWEDNLARSLQSIPTSAILISTKYFHRNDQGSLTLGPLNSVIQHYINTNTKILITGDDCDNILDNSNLLNDILAVLMSFTANKLVTANKDYWDLPQNPLQPLRDNLQFRCYENFELSRSKYYTYQLAIQDYISISIKHSKGIDCVVFLVAGCGRGPLIQSIINAQLCILGHVKYCVVAIDKNPHSLTTVKSKTKDPNWEKVIVLNCDMRGTAFIKVLRALIKDKECDLCVVSELLGSSGDNELAPECLGGLSDSLDTSGITQLCSVTYIPHDCLNFWEPIYAPKLYQNIQRLAATTPSILDSPSVSCLNCISRPCEIMAGFKFDFPSNAQDNFSRYVSIEFTANYTSEIHGFAGYFLSNLHGNYFISILPEKYPHESHDISWFPLFLPLRTPLFVNKGDKFTFHLWRKQHSTSVWYEWAVANPLLSQLYNSRGKSWSISKVV